MVFLATVNEDGPLEKHRLLHGFERIGEDQEGPALSRRNIWSWRFQPLSRSSVLTKLWPRIPDSAAGQKQQHRVVAPPVRV